jgi:hypothetical protein
MKQRWTGRRNRPSGPSLLRSPLAFNQTEVAAHGDRHDARNEDGKTETGYPQLVYPGGVPNERIFSVPSLRLLPYARTASTSEVDSTPLPVIALSE